MLGRRVQIEATLEYEMRFWHGEHESAIPSTLHLNEHGPPEGTSQAVHLLPRMVAVVSFLLQYRNLIAMGIMYCYLQYFIQKPCPVPSICRSARQRPGPNRVLHHGNPVMQVSAETRFWSKSFPYGPYLVHGPCQAGPPIDRDTRRSF